MGWKGVTVPKLVLHTPQQPLEQQSLEISLTHQILTCSLLLIYTRTFALTVPTALCALHPENHPARPVPLLPSACCPKCLLFMEAWQILYTVAVLVFVCTSATGKRKFHEGGVLFFVHCCHLSTYNSAWHSRMSSNTRCLNKWMDIETRPQILSSLYINFLQNGQACKERSHEL